MSVRTLITTVAAITLATVAAPRAAAAQDRGAAPGQSIQVRGHWVIEVYDGEELVERREFDNALAPGGAEVLAGILSVQDTVTAPGVVIYDSALQVLEDITTVSGDTVDLSTPVSGADAGKIIVSGAYVLETAHAVGAVAYEVFTFEGTGWLHEPVTLKEFDTPIDVAGGQTVNVTVTISFSG